MNPLPLLFIMTFLVYVDLRILTAILPSISASLGASPGAAGLALTAYSATYGLGQLVYGPLSDRLNRIAVVRAAGGGFCLCTLLSALALTSGQFIAVRLLAGLFAGAVIPLTLVFIGDTVEYGRRQAVLGRVSAIASIAMAFSASIGGTVAHFVSWRFMMLGYGLIALIPVFLMWKVPTGTPTIPAGPPEHYADFLKNRRSLFIYLAVFLESALLWGPMTYIGSFVIDHYRWDQLKVGLLIALFGIGMMVSGLLIGRIRQRLSEKSLAVLGGVLMGVSYLACLPLGSSAVLATALFALGVGYAILHTTLQLRGTEISSASRGKAFSLFAVSNFLGLAIGSAAFGWMADGEHYGPMFVLAALGLAGIGLATAFAPQGSAEHRSGIDLAGQNKI